MVLIEYKVSSVIQPPMLSRKSFNSFNSCVSSAHFSVIAMSETKLSSAESRNLKKKYAYLRVNTSTQIPLLKSLSLIDISDLSSHSILVISLFLGDSV